MSGAAPVERREMRLMTLAAALHEAGHAVISAAILTPLARAVARHGRGEVVPDKDKMAMLAAQHRRRFPTMNPTPRGAEVLAAIRSMAMSCAGALAVELRQSRRPRAPWGRFGRHYADMSPRDRRAWYAGAERLREANVHASACGYLIFAWVEETLQRHSPTLSRLAVALYRHGRLTGVELARLLARVAADPLPRAKLFELAHLLATDPEFIWPVRRAGERPADQAGSGKRAPTVGDVVGDAAWSAPER
jgi:hypothetical protein